MYITYNTIKNTVQKLDEKAVADIVTLHNDTTEQCGKGLNLAKPFNQASLFLGPCVDK